MSYLRVNTTALVYFCSPLVTEYVFIYSGMYIEGGRVFHHSLVCRCICDRMTFVLP